MNAAVTTIEKAFVLPTDIADRALGDALSSAACRMQGLTWEELKAELLASVADFNAKTNLTDSVLLGREPTEEEQAVWDAANDREKAALDAVFAHRSPDWRVFSEKVALLAPARISTCIEDDILEALTLDAANLSAPPPAFPPVVRLKHNNFLFLPDDPSDTPWGAAVRRLNAAMAAHREWDARSEAAEAACHAVCPPENMELNESWGEPWPRFSVARQLDGSTGADLSPEHREALRPLVSAYEQRCVEIYAEHGLPSPHVDLDPDPLYDEWCGSIQHLLDTTPPHAQALAAKQRVAAYFNDDDKLGFDNLPAVMFARRWIDAEGGAIRIHEDTLRLAGIDDPILRLERFDAYCWVRDFTAAGGVVSDYGVHRRNFGIVLPDGAGGDAATLKAPIDACPIRREAVRLAARHRRRDGGDPFVWHCFETKPGKSAALAAFKAAVEGGAT